MTGTQVAIMVAIFFAVDAIVLYAVVTMCANTWKELAKAYPINDRATGPWREFQSVSIDIFNFGLCVHICADADYVHIAPTKVLRKLGVTPVSIPRAAMKDVQPSAFRTARARLPKNTLTLPRWAAMPNQA